MVPIPEVSVHVALTLPVDLARSFASRTELLGGGARRFGCSLPSPRLADPSRGESGPPATHGFGPAPGPFSGRLAAPMYGKATSLFVPPGPGVPSVIRKPLSSSTLSVVMTPLVSKARLVWSTASVSLRPLPTNWLPGPTKFP